MANHMAEVAKMLGIELGEEFEIDLNNVALYMYAVLTDEGLKVNKTNMIAPLQNSSSEILEWILCGLVTIKRKPWKPEIDETYWCVSTQGVVSLSSWKNDIIDVHLYKLGNCYHTYEEARANRDKWVAFYASDQILEV